jgi:hypothetical protein
MTQMVGWTRSESRANAPGAMIASSVTISASVGIASHRSPHGAEPTPPDDVTSGTLRRLRANSMYAAKHGLLGADFHYVPVRGVRVAGEAPGADRKRWDLCWTGRGARCEPKGSSLECRRHKE